MSEAVIFDLDGVLVDSEQVWDDVRKEYALEVGGTYPEAAARAMMGMSSLEWSRYMADDLGVPGTPEQINAAVVGRPAGMAVTTHLCRGNFRSSWVASGGYDFVAEALFSELAVDGFFLEFDDERSGRFEPLRFVPAGKMVVLGLVTTKRPGLESKDELRRRVDEAAKFVPLDQLGLSGQCGFSSTVEGNALTYDEQVAKLRLIVETAHQIWG